jgi:hypothetical protein
VAIIEGGMIPMLEQLPEPVAVEITRFLAGLPA